MIPVLEGLMDPDDDRRDASVKRLISVSLSICILLRASQS